ncbi:8588_t:CDS:10 [Acaulospora morrowiae]|uniref:8588_t:CDS:1 n=1 Tax=Acaulospora morrowiae TaxID=94023 RepID=A0A9N8ZBW1_9GLOM|nr:8588_t:CDS:10 [Acaulospora morrowiae]
MCAGDMSHQEFAKKLLGKKRKDFEAHDDNDLPCNRMLLNMANSQKHRSVRRERGFIIVYQDSALEITPETFQILHFQPKSHEMFSDYGIVVKENMDDRGGERLRIVSELMMMSGTAFSTAMEKESLTQNSVEAYRKRRSAEQHPYMEREKDNRKNRKNRREAPEVVTRKNGTRLTYIDQSTGKTKGLTSFILANEKTSIRVSRRVNIIRAQVEDPLRTQRPDEISLRSIAHEGKKKNRQQSKKLWYYHALMAKRQIRDITTTRRKGKLEARVTSQTTLLSYEHEYRIHQSMCCFDILTFHNWQMAGPQPSEFKQ